MSDKTMSVHDATADEIEAYSVTVQGVAALAPSARGIAAKMRFFMMKKFEDMKDNDNCCDVTKKRTRTVN